MGISALAVARSELVALLAIGDAEPRDVVAGGGEVKLTVLAEAIAAGDERRVASALGAIGALSDEGAVSIGNSGALTTLAFPPFGSQARLLAASRLGAGSLGPYLCNAPRLLPDSRQMLGLAASAANDLAAPLALLAIWLPADALHDLVDTIADLGLVPPLAALLGHAERCASRNQFAPLWAIRDAALDLGVPDIAASAQRLVVRLRPGIALEQAILGRILLSANREMDADLAFAAATACDGAPPTRQPATRGFGTDPARWRRRMTCRTAIQGEDKRLIV
jgi:hypothetical protein